MNIISATGLTELEVDEVKVGENNVLINEDGLQVYHPYNILIPTVPTGFLNVHDEIENLSIDKTLVDAELIAINTALNLTASSLINVAAVTTTVGITAGGAALMASNALSGLLLKQDKIHTITDPINLNNTDSNNRILSLKYSDPFKLDASGNLALKYDSTLSLDVSGNLKSSSQWITTGNNIYYNTGNVGIGTTNPSATFKLDVVGQARISNVLNLMNGNFSANFINNQILLGDTLSEYRHAIKTRHYNLTPHHYNAIDFYLWKQGVNANRLEIGASHAMSITANGIGIGKTDPAYSLDVIGQAKISSVVNLVNGNAGSSFNNNQILFGYAGSEIYRHAIKTRHQLSTTHNQNAIDFYLWKNGQVNTDVGGTHGMSITAGGVAIGKTNPDTTLDVSGTVTGTLFTGSGASLTSLNASNISSGTLLVSRGGIGTTTLTANQLLIGNGTGALLQSANLTWDNSNNRLGIGNTTPTCTLSINPENTLLYNGYNHTEAALLLTHNATPTSSTAINDPKSILHLVRVGTSTQAWSSRASFKLCRWENNGGHSRTRLDINLSNNSYDDVNIVSFRSDGRVGICKTNPDTTLDISGTVTATLFSGSGESLTSLNASNISSGTLAVSKGGTSITTIAANNLLGSSAENTIQAITIGTGLSLSDGTLISTQVGTPSQWTTATNDIYYNSGNVGIGITNPSTELDISGNVRMNKTLNLMNGNSITNIQNNQILLGWGGTERYRHAIKTRHSQNTSTDNQNGIDFYVWKTSLLDTDIASTPTLSITNVGVGVGKMVPTTALDVSGTVTSTLFTGSAANLTNATITNDLTVNNNATISKDLSVNQLLTSSTIYTKNLYVNAGGSMTINEFNNFLDSQAVIRFWKAFQGKITNIANRNSEQNYGSNIVPVLTNTLNLSNYMVKYDTPTNTGFMQIVDYDPLGGGFPDFVLGFSILFNSLKTNTYQRIFNVWTGTPTTSSLKYIMETRIIDPPTVTGANILIQFKVCTQNSPVGSYAYGDEIYLDLGIPHIFILKVNQSTIQYFLTMYIDGNLFYQGTVQNVGNSKPREIWMGAPNDRGNDNDTDFKYTDVVFSQNMTDLNLCYKAMQYASSIPTTVLIGKTYIQDLYYDKLFYSGKQYNGTYEDAVSVTISVAPTTTQSTRRYNLISTPEISSSNFSATPIIINSVSNLTNNTGTSGFLYYSNSDTSTNAQVKSNIWSDITDKPTNFQSDWNSTVTNKPSNFQSDWNTTIINKPTLFDGTWTSLTGKPTNFQSDWNTTIINKPTLTSSQWTTSGVDIYYNSGSVGIGKTNPSATLDVNGNFKINQTITLLNGNTTTSTTNNQILLGWAGTEQLRHAIKTRHSTNDIDNAIDFYVWKNGQLYTDIGTNHGMSITGVGVGIGKTNPTSALDVNGTITATSFNGSGVSTLSSINATNITSGTLTVSGTFKINQTLNLLNGNSHPDITNNQILLGWNGTEQLRHVIKTRHLTTDSGNAIDFYLWKSGQLYTDIGTNHLMSITGVGVGIGKTNPTSALDVNGTIKGTLFNGSGESLTSLNATNITSGILSVSQGGTGVNTLTANKLLLGNGTGALVSANLTWDNLNNKLGIGITNPSASLDINGNLKINQTINILNGNSHPDITNNQIILGWAGTEQLRHAIKTRHSTSTSGNAIDFYLWKSEQLFTDIGSSHLMSITGVGVGIGNTSPLYKLDVSNDINYTGILRKNGVDILATKQNTINLTANKALISDSSGNVSVSTVSNTELGYLSGASSSIQTQLDGKQATLTIGTGLSLSNGTLTATGSGSSQWTSGTGLIYYDSGNVGIGITNPTGKLDVIGNTNITGNISLITTGNANFIEFNSDSYLGRANIAGSLSASSAIGDIVLRSATGKKLILQSGAGNGLLNINSTSVGIGITNPSSILDVNGKITVQNNDVNILLPATGKNNVSFSLNNEGTLGMCMYNGSYSSSAVVGDTILRALNGNLILQCGSAASHIYIKSNGNVGIGLTNPTSTLDVNGDLSVRSNSTWHTILNLTNNNAVSAGISIGGSENTTLGVNNMGFRYFNSTNSYGIVIANSSYIGIGKTNPVSKLDVRDDTNPVITVGKSNGTSGLINFGNSGHGVGRELTTNNVILWTDGTGGNLLFRTMGTTERMRINPESGNVSIGNQNNNYKLDVSGDVNITGKFRVNGVPIVEKYTFNWGSINGYGSVTMLPSTIIGNTTYSDGLYSYYIHETSTSQIFAFGTICFWDNGGRCNVHQASARFISTSHNGNNYFVIVNDNNETRTYIMKLTRLSAYVDVLY